MGRILAKPMTPGGNSRFLCFVLLSTVIACGGSANTCEAAAGDHDYVAVRTSITAPACAYVLQRGDASLQLQRFMSCGARYTLRPR
jgi:hypothetical protein